MVKFSCFPAHISCHKPKKMLQHSPECMHKKSQDRPMDLSSKALGSSPVSDATHASLSKDLSGSNHAAKWSPSSSFCIPNPSPVVASFDVKNTDGSCKLERTSSLTNADALRALCIKKSKSLGSGLDKKGKVSNFIDTEDETDQGLSCGDVHEIGSNRFFSASQHNSTGSNEFREHEIVLPDFSGHDNHNGYCMNVEPCKMHADLIQDEHVDFSIGHQQLDAEVHEEPGSNASDKPLLMQRSYSLGDVKDDARSLKNTSLAHSLSGCHSRSYNDLHALNSGGKVFIAGDGYCSQLASVKSGNASLPNVSEPVSLTNHPHISGQESDANCAQSVQSDHSSKITDHAKSETTNEDNFGCGDRLHEVQESYRPTSPSLNYDNMIVQEIDTANAEKLEVVNEQIEGFDEYPRHWWDGMSSKEFSIKRIEHWVNTIDVLESSSPLEDIGECSGSSSEVKKHSDGVRSSAAASKTESVLPHAVQVANNYISTLPTSSTSAQMANFGLPAIPQLSFFNSLRVVNLSGNAIVRIASGALPKGLHVLNLSRNSISVIEGLRDLTRLRLLDLSYNRIFRIGYGLASCSSLKELYLAGNKLSEVEGLHRLLKLQILDLSYNKISTAKCLGQLAANYSSLQVLNLEGNPAQKNVGDEQLKKSLASLLPHLVYLNRKPIRATSSKEASDRASRSVSMGTRSDHKIPRKVGHGSSKASANGLIQAAALSKQSKGYHHGRIPSGRSKVTYHQANIDNRLLGAQITTSMRRSRSEGTMNVL